MSDLKQACMQNMCVANQTYMEGMREATSRDVAAEEKYWRRVRYGAATLEGSP
jgi:hypothetical protein